MEALEFETGDPSLRGVMTPPGLGPENPSRGKHMPPPIGCGDGATSALIAVTRPWHELAHDKDEREPSSTLPKGSLWRHAPCRAPRKPEVVPMRALDRKAANYVLFIATLSSTWLAASGVRAGEASCTTDADCTYGLTCQDTRALPQWGNTWLWPDSIPVMACEPGPCTTNADCAPNMTCVPASTPTGSICTPNYDFACTLTSDCGPGFDCAQTQVTCQVSDSPPADASPGSWVDASVGSTPCDPDAGPDAGACSTEYYTTCAYTGPMLCQVQTLVCQADKDCPLGWTCGSAQDYAHCTHQMGSSAPMVCPDGSTQSTCAPPFYHPLDVYGISEPDAGTGVNGSDGGMDWTIESGPADAAAGADANAGWGEPPADGGADATEDASASRDAGLPLREDGCDVPAGRTSWASLLSALLAALGAAFGRRRRA